MTVETWANIKPGQTLKVKKLLNRRSFRIEVAAIDCRPGSAYAFVTGKRLTAQGKPSRLRTHIGCREGQRQELIHITEIEIA